MTFSARTKQTALSTKWVGSYATEQSHNSFYQSKRAFTHCQYFSTEGQKCLIYNSV